MLNRLKTLLFLGICTCKLYAITDIEGIVMASNGKVIDFVSIVATPADSSNVFLSSTFYR